MRYHDELAVMVAMYGGRPDYSYINPHDYQYILDTFALWEAQESILRYLAGRLREARRLRRLGVLDAAFRVRS